MKKHMALAAAAFALVGAAAVPAGSAFAKTKKPPSAVATAIRCGFFESLDNSYDAQITALGTPPPGSSQATELAFLKALEDSNDAKLAGCGFTD